MNRSRLVRALLEQIDQVIEARARDQVAELLAQLGGRAPPGRARRRRRRRREIAPEDSEREAVAAPPPATTTQMSAPPPFLAELLRDLEVQQSAPPPAPPAPPARPEAPPPVTAPPAPEPPPAPAAAASRGPAQSDPSTAQTDPSAAPAEEVSDDEIGCLTWVRSRLRRKDDGTTRPRTIAGKLSRVERRAAALVVYPDDVERPRTRGDCVDQPRPCPWVSCAHHLYLDVGPNGSIKLNMPEREVWELKESCALDVADRGGLTLEAVGEILHLTRERVRQIEIGAEVSARGDQQLAAAAGEEAA